MMPEKKGMKKAHIGVFVSLCARTAADSLN
jgi:hypothetical protein